MVSGITNVSIWITERYHFMQFCIQRFLSHTLKNELKIYTIHVLRVKKYVSVIGWHNKYLSHSEERQES